MGRWILFGLVPCLLFGLAACGSQTVQVGIGDITLTAINHDGTPGPGCSVGAPGPFPTVPVEFAISGVGFATVPGNTVIVRFTAVGNETPFYRGTERVVDVEGTVGSDAIICGMTPTATVCGVASVDATVEVILQSAVSDDSTAATQGPVFVATFAAPTIISLSLNCVGSLSPTALVVNGTGFGSDGDQVTVIFASDENLPGGDTIFADGTTPSVDVVGVVGGGGTTITTQTPKCTNQVEPVGLGANPLHALSDPSEDATITVVLWNDSCSLAGTSPPFAFNAPEGDTILAPTLVLPDFVPQTIPTPFVIDGVLDPACPDPFGPVGGTVQISFSAPGFPSAPAMAFQLDASGLGTDDFDIVDAEIVSPTQIRGMTPACRATVDFLPVVRIHFEDGMIVPVTTPFTWEPPPAITMAPNLDAGTGNGINANLASTVFLGGGTHTIQITGTDFANPNATGTPVCAIYDRNTGMTRHLGTGFPVQVPADNDLGPVYTTSDTQIDGETRLEPMLAQLDTDNDGLVLANLRVTAADGQFGEYVLQYRTASSPINLSVDAASTNNNTSITIDPWSVSGDFGSAFPDPTPGANIAVVAGDDPLPGPGIFQFQGQQIFLSTSVDGGENWLNSTLGAAQDGFSALEFRNFATASYDGAGNLWVSYMVDDLTGSPAAGPQSHIVLLRSSDQGLTWTDASDPSIQGFLFAGIDRPHLATGLDGSTGGTGAQVACVSFVDLVPAALTPGVEVLVAGRQQAFALGGPLGAFAPPAVANDAVYGGAFLLQHARCAIGPDGELYTVWNDFVFGVPAPAWYVVFDRDLDGLFGATFGFDNDAFVDTVFLPATPRASTPDFGPPVPMTDIRVIQTGTHAGRVVVAYEDVVPGTGGTPNPDDTMVLTVASDTFGYSWYASEAVPGAGLTDQYLPALGVDPQTGRIYVTWTDTNSVYTPAQAHRLSAASNDGRTWSDPFMVGGASVAPASDLEYSDYGIQSGVTAFGGYVWAAWAHTPFASPANRKDVYVRLYQQRAESDPTGP